MNEVTRTYFKNLAGQETGQSAADMKAVLATPPNLAAAARLSAEPSFNSNFRTTCVATRLIAGHANNALPQTAQANVNCRIFPGHSPEEIRQVLIGRLRRSTSSPSNMSPMRAWFPTPPGKKSHGAARAHQGSL
jgi:acetylornithine deacetylase/succinyl-diaminopimelate desuccinylase-like protein